MSLNDKRVLVTGGNRRLGLAIAQQLGKSGARVAITYRGNRDRAEAALANLPENSVAVPARLDDSKTIEDLVVNAEELLAGHIDVLVNNAAEFQFDNLQTVTEETIQAHLKVNLVAPVLLTRFVTRHGPRETPGLILNMLDYKIHNPFPDFLSYTLTKHAMEGFTRVAARGLAPHWRVCGVAPGYTLPGPTQSPEDFERTHDAVPLKRGSRPSDVADAIVYLINAEAITGQFITVDGGAHMLAQERDFLFT